MEQWSVRVRKEKGENTRLSLLRRGLLDRSLKIHTSGEDLVFPVTSPAEGIYRDFFETLEISPSLPRYELIGGIALLQERNEVEAERVLHSRCSVHTVLFPMSAVEGRYRVRRFEVLAGIPTTRTEYTEYGHRYIIDLGVAYFSSRLSEERQRILHLLGRKEKVLDLFAGVGPFAITFSGQAFLVVACDINPDAISLLLENSTRNQCNNILPVLADASHLDAIIPWQFSRIIMNLPIGGQEFLENAFSYCTSGGFIHFYILQSKKGEYLPLIEQLPFSSVEERVVRSYSPDKWHAVYDIQVA